MELVSETWKHMGSGADGPGGVSGWQHPTGQEWLCCGFLGMALR